MRSMRGGWGGAPDVNLNNVNLMKGGMKGMKGVMKGGMKGGWGPPV